MQEQTEWLPLADVAKMMKTTPLNVLMHIKRGLLHGVEEDGVWQVERHSLVIFLAKTGGSKAEGICSGNCAKRHACGSGCS